MGRHIVGAFAVVLERGIAVGRQFRGEVFQIAADGWIGVLADDQRCAGVMDEQMAEAPGRSSIARRSGGSAV